MVLDNSSTRANDASPRATASANASANASASPRAIASANASANASAPRVISYADITRARPNSTNGMTNSVINGCSNSSAGSGVNGSVNGVDNVGGADGMNIKSAPVLRRVRSGSLDSSTLGKE